MQNKLSKNVLATITYYDIFDYPLTSFEIWKYLISWNVENEIHLPDRQIYEDNDKIALKDIMKELGSMELKNHLDECRGFYFIKGRKELVGQRIERGKISEKKFKIIKRAAWLLRFAPFVRMISITGRMAMKNADQKSDLDFIVALEKEHIFTGRIFVTAITHILGIRRHGEKIANRICLNYFITDESLEISLKDLFSSSEYSFAIPIFGWEVFRDFQEKNSWIKNYRPNFELQEIANWKMLKDSSFSKFARKIGEILFGLIFIEHTFKKFQMNRISSDPRTHKTGSFVTANDNELIFLPKPQGPKVFLKFKEKMEKVA